ncbi:MAG: hypothetical protein Fur002_17410 [Anaerolineales bacterium]
MKPSSTFFLIVVFLLVFTISVSAPIDNDMWWHLRSGEEMAQQGKILLTDEFSYTKFGETWVNAFWLSDLILYGLWRLGGFFAVTVATALMAAAVMLVVFSQMQGSPYSRGLLILLAMSGAVANWTPRPQLASFLLLAILDAFLHRHFRIKPQPLWILPPLFILWGNLHGGYIWGALLLVAVLAGEALDILFANQPAANWKTLGALAAWSALAFLLLPLNPNGFALWRLPFTQVNVSLAIQEWLSPNFHQFYAHPLLWLLFLWVAALGLGSARASFADLLKGMGFAYLFFFAQRNLVVYAIVITPIVSRALVPALGRLAAAPFVQRMSARLESSPSREPLSLVVTRSVNLIFIAALVGLNLFYAFLVSRPANIDLLTPARSAAWIESNRPQGRIFNSYNWGGYVVWRLRGYPVFIDGRADLYGNAMLQTWMEISSGSPRGLQLLDEYEINLIYLEPSQPLLAKLPADQWLRAYADSQMVVYQRILP